MINWIWQAVAWNQIRLTVLHVWLNHMKYICLKLWLCVRTEQNQKIIKLQISWRQQLCPRHLSGCSVTSIAAHHCPWCLPRAELPVLSTRGKGTCKLMAMCIRLFPGPHVSALGSGDKLNDKSERNFSCWKNRTMLHFKDVCRIAAAIQLKPSNIPNHISLSSEIMWTVFSEDLSVDSIHSTVHEGNPIRQTNKDHLEKVH